MAGGISMELAKQAAKAALLALLALAYPCGATTTNAADPQFAIVGNGTAPPTVGLNGDIQIRIVNGASIQPNKLQLRLNGWPLGVEPRVLASKDQPTFVFKLLRTDANRQMWDQLLGSPFFKAENGRYLVPVGIEVDGKALEMQTPPQPDASSQPKIDLILFKDWAMTLGLIFAAVIAVSTVILGWKKPIVRDGLIPQMRLSDRPYSLGRTQMAFWFCLVLISFVFILVVTQDTNSVTAETFALIGISASTALGAVAIDQSKNDAVVRTQRTLEGMGIKTAADVDRLYAQDPAVFARTILPDAQIPAGLRPGLQANANPTVGQFLDEYKIQVRDYVSGGFLADLVNDVNGPTIHRWQIVIWTLLLGGVYLVRVYTNLETPAFGTNLLALMGISSGVYLGFKIPEKQT